MDTTEVEINYNLPILNEDDNEKDDYHKDKDTSKLLNDKDRLKDEKLKVKENCDNNLPRENKDNATKTKIWEMTLEDEQEDDPETQCGFGSIRGAYLQKLASKKTFLMVYGGIGLATLGLAAYMTATISTVEKRFRIPSQTSGVLASAWDVANLICTLIVSYLGGKGNKPKWIAGGTFLLCLSCWLRTLPHFIYGPGEDALMLTKEFDSSLQSKQNETYQGGSTCHLNVFTEDCSEGGTVSVISSSIIFIGNLVLGIGTSVYFTLGITYLDDNCRKNKAPVMIATSHVIRMLGPTLGFLLGSYYLNQYVEPSLHPTITPDDPRWIGAWWKGHIPLSFIFIIMGFLVILFPKTLPRTKQRKIQQLSNKTSLQQKLSQEERKTSFKDFKIALKRLFSNKILLCNSLSSVFYVFALIGYWNFMPKYMETQFSQSSSKASLLTGTVGLLFTALGIMASGLIISKFKPRPRYLAGWNVFVECLDVVGYICYAFVGCPNQDLHGSWGTDNNWNLTANCNGHCDCAPTIKYSPVCSSDGTTSFFSACHAGCTDFSMINGTKTYINCSCLPDQGYVTDGPCPQDCTTGLITFLAIHCTLRFFSSSGRAGNTILQFRCVNEDDKALSIGVLELLLSAFTFIPGPILYGVIMDSTCMVWGLTCGKTGNCWLYDGRLLKYVLNFTAAGFIIVAVMFDIGVWYHVKHLKIYDDEDEDDDINQDNNGERETDIKKKINSNNIINNCTE